MKKVLALENATVQYWIDELPEVPEISVSMDNDRLEVNNINDMVSASKICMELYLHKDVSNYGMLGIEFIPDKNIKAVEIQIQYTTENISHYQSEINKYDKAIFSGLLQEYVPYIKSRLIDSSGKELYAGSLIVSCAANSEVGSSPRVFCLITDIIFELYKMICENKVVNEEAMMRAMILCGLEVKLK